MRLFASIVATGLLAGTCLGADWPKWRGPDGTGISKEMIADVWPEGGPKKVWEQKVGIGFSSPIAQDGKIYLFTQVDKDDVLTAYEAGTGKILWTQSYGRTADFQYPGARGTPTIDGDRIYTYGACGDLVCRNLADGKQIWKINVLDTTKAKPTQWGQASSPQVDDKNVYVMSGINAQAIVLAVDKMTGKTAWGSEAKGTGSYATILPIEIDKKREFIAFGGEMVYAMNAETGATIWSVPWKTEYDINAATPIFEGNHLFVTSAYGSGSMMLALDATSAKSEWVQKDVQCKFQPPVLDGKVLYCSSGEPGQLKCLSWPDGKTLWTAKEPALRLGVGGSIVRVGDKLITLSDHGKLNLLHADETGYKLISKASIFDYDKVWSTPTIYQGKLYAKGKDQLVCLDISAEAAKP